MRRCSGVVFSRHWLLIIYPVRDDPADPTDRSDPLVSTFFRRRPASRHRRHCACRRLTVRCAERSIHHFVNRTPGSTGWCAAVLLRDSSSLDSDRLLPDYFHWYPFLADLRCTCDLQSVECFQQPRPQLSVHVSPIPAQATEKLRRRLPADHGYLIAPAAVSPILLL